jgi:pimeloyl-ACP methyl ester carboxylesterase
VGGAGERLAVRLSQPTEARPGLGLLYLHGFGSKQSGEKATFFRARAVAAGLGFCSLDFRGHGESDGGMRELTLSRNLEDVAAARALLAARGWRRVALFGSSMGGATALWYAALHPEEVCAGVHIAPAVGFRRGFERWAGPARLARWRREGTIRFENEHVACDLGWQLMTDLRRYPMSDLLARYRTPTLFFQGQLDASVEWRDVARFARLARPGTVELVLFADGDHRLTDRKELLWQRAHAFLSALEERNQDERQSTSV